jgi:hypothetical protein
MPTPPGKARAADASVRIRRLYSVEKLRRLVVDGVSMSSAWILIGVQSDCSDNSRAAVGTPSHVTMRPGELQIH